MAYNSGFTARYYAEIIDPSTWSETGIMQIIDGSVARKATDLRQTASLTVTDYDYDTEQWVRVYMDAKQESSITHEALFTGIVTNPKREIEGVVVTKPLECYSVLKPCEDIILDRGWYVPAGANGGAVIKRLLEATPAPVDIADGAPELSDFIVAESDESNLTMIDKILDAIGWLLQITGDGTIHILPKPQEPAAVFSAKGLDIIEKSLTITKDWFACPNVFRASAGDATAVARDDDPDSPLSTVSRGREIIMAEDDVTLATNEGIGQYAQRRLKEEQAIVESAEYSRRYVSDVNVGDKVKLIYDEIDGTYTVDEQNITLTYNGQTTEKVSR